ncbi:hypothetical protein [Flavobacterium sp.]|uniref:hypothetical protein n=1 Tax=Flavobacterium sp. TaxID=239 RepID=UPI002B4AC12B|nr:hypothetical protein [Flavobacterium sp.]HLP64801.1 hypothetical protein [Flavobacterium sp.]
MKQLKKSFLAVVIAGFLTTSCSQVAPTKVNTTESQNVVDDTINPQEKLTYSMVLPEQKSLGNSMNNIGYSFISNGSFYSYQLANNSEFFSKSSKKPTVLITILACLLLTLSTCKIYLNNIDDDSMWMESELKRIRRIKKQ